MTNSAENCTLVHMLLRAALSVRVYYVAIAIGIHDRADAPPLWCPCNTNIFCQNPVLMIYKKEWHLKVSKFLID